MTIQLLELIQNMAELRFSDTASVKKWFLTAGEIEQKGTNKTTNKYKAS
jgi:hypothetical protein